VEPWRARLEAAGVPIESRVTWPRGGESLYVRDPDGHSVELLTRGLWTIY
jgi:catechol 2,3-dioxygenase-like lactoylglutathione lyase family enzyme